MAFIKELKRRKVFRVAVLYFFVAWLIMQVADVMFPALNLPDWTITLVVTLLIMGFPLALILAWAFELTPEGLKKERDVDHADSVTHTTGRKFDFLIIAVLVVALGYFTYDKLVPSTGRDAALVETTKQAVTERVVTKQAGSTEIGKSIAVLPFVNMSEDAGNEYFSDGLSEELLNMLVKIPELRVAPRTSSFSFKGKDLKISEIAHELNVNHELEGSVRKSGNKVRITVQLIKADDGFQLWSETYDRTLDDIFVVQDDIANAVVNTLKITLMGSMPKARETDPEVYSLYLQGKYFENLSGKENIEKALAAFEQALAIDPDYPGIHITLGVTYLHKGDPETALMEIEKNPSWPIYAFHKARILSTLGNEMEAKAIINQLLKSSAHLYPTPMAAVYAWRGENDLAFEWLERAFQQEPENLAYFLRRPQFKGLETDLRYPVFLEKLGLLEAWKAMPAG